jgi:predicted 3-demethylubiquinone-9 3-methyltransferase (glyoxalase superfamily)
MELSTCLWFNGRAREAAIFYTSVFPDSSMENNWIAPTDTPGNKQGEEIVVNFRMFGRPQAMLEMRKIDLAAMKAAYLNA